MNALLVFAKLPVAGSVKTRLTPAITPQDAALLYRAFLADSAGQYTRLDCSVRYHIAPLVAAMDPDEARRLIPMSAESTLHEQRGAGLGERMLNAFLDAFKAGFERIVVIGSDHPTLPTEFVAHAFDELQAPRTVVLGPAADGGYYLLGLNELYPTLFQGMRYSHGDVFEDTLDRVAELDTRLVVLPEWSDVDTPDELISLYQSFWPHVAGQQEHAAADLQRRYAPNTADALKRLAREYGWVGGDNSE